jgi:hypothetical protein
MPAIASTAIADERPAAGHSGAGLESLCNVIESIVPFMDRHLSVECRSKDERSHQHENADDRAESTLLEQQRLPVPEHSECEKADN